MYEQDTTTRIEMFDIMFCHLNFSIHTHNLKTFIILLIKNKNMKNSTKILMIQR